MSLSSLPAPFARRALGLGRARRISKVPLNHFAARYLDSTLNRTRPRNAMPCSGSCLLMRARTTLLHSGTCFRASATRIVPSSMTALLPWLRLPRRMFLESEGSYHADSESAVIFISIGDHYLGPMRVIREQYFAGSPRRGWRNRPLQGGFHGEGRSGQAHL